jgi:hypothetical protein
MFRYMSRQFMYVLWLWVCNLVPEALLDLSQRFPDEKTQVINFYKARELLPGSNDKKTRAPTFIQACKIFLGTTYQNGKIGIYQNDHKMYQMAIKCTILAIK